MSIFLSQRTFVVFVFIDQSDARVTQSYQAAWISEAHLFRFLKFMNATLSIFVPCLPHVVHAFVTRVSHLTKHRDRLDKIRIIKTDNPVEWNNRFD